MRCVPIITMLARTCWRWRAMARRAKGIRDLFRIAAGYGFLRNESERSAHGLFRWHGCFGAKGNACALILLRAILWTRIFISATLNLERAGKCIYQPLPGLILSHTHLRKAVQRG